MLGAKLLIFVNTVKLLATSVASYSLQLPVLITFQICCLIKMYMWETILIQSWLSNQILNISTDKKYTWNSDLFIAFLLKANEDFSIFPRPWPQSLQPHWAIPEKIQTGGLRIYFFEKPPGIFHFLLYPWKFQANKAQPLDIPHFFFLVTLGNFTLFLINPLEIPHAMSLMLLEISYP